MNIITLVELINNLLPDEKILADVSCALNSELEKGGFNNLSREEIPSKDTQTEVLTKRFIMNNYETGFGNHYVSKVAIGGVERHRNGVVIPKYFFATLYYTEDLRLITVDFEDESE
ncbi:hypothetical protein CAL7716_081650 [Calothrix sp. PCC 7716]|nr:hypothetical protein CAL7716_081650 [Calothrix sp. PCC 7716]